MHSFFPYPTFRDGQDLIYSTILESHQAVLVNAPTGKGKTITALSAMLKKRNQGDRIVVCVKTINQIEPMLREWKEIRQIGHQLTILPLLATKPPG